MVFADLSVSAYDAAEAQWLLHHTGHEPHTFALAALEKTLFDILRPAAYPSHIVVLSSLLPVECSDT
jgi:hypothetical protein